MAEKTKHNTNSSKKAQRQQGAERRKQIFSILLIVVAVIVLLSILSYSRRDEALLDRLSAFDSIRFLYNSDIQAKVVSIQNHLGLIGALLANFFVLSTIGFSSIVFPLLAMMWDWSFF